MFPAHAASSFDVLMCDSRTFWLPFYRKVCLTLPTRSIFFASVLKALRYLQSLFAPLLSLPLFAAISHEHFEQHVLLLPVTTTTTTPSFRANPYHACFSCCCAAVILALLLYQRRLPQARAGRSGLRGHHPHHVRRLPEMGLSETESRRYYVENHPEKQGNG